MRVSRSRRTYSYVVIAFWTVFMVFPLYWVITTSFKTGPALNTRATFVPWVDFEPSLHAWKNLFGENLGNWQKYFANSLVVGISTALVSTIIGLMGGYALARLPGVGFMSNNQVSFMFLQQRMFPAALLALPMLVIFRELSLLDTQVSLIILYSAFTIPFSTWLSTDFVRSIPNEIEESALIDGCSRVGAVLRIVLPLAAPGMVGVFVLALAGAWNEYFFALVLTFGKAVTVPIFVQNQLNNASNVGWWNVAAIGVSSFLPLSIVSLVLQRFIQRGLTRGAIK